MMKCDLCEKSAVVHEVVIRNGKKREVHLCEHHAKEAGVDLPDHQPLNKVLTQFVMSQSGSDTSSAATRSASRARKTCANCGMTFARFRQTGTLGCSECYDTFETQLGALIERAHCGATHHSGKVPRRAGGNIDRQRLIQRLVKELDEAVAAEQYERAARLRDRLGNLESDDATAAPQHVRTTDSTDRQPSDTDAAS